MMSNALWGSMAFRQVIIIICHALGTVIRLTDMQIITMLLCWAFISKQEIAVFDLTTF